MGVINPVVLVIPYVLQEWRHVYFVWSGRRDHEHVVGRILLSHVAVLTVVGAIGSSGCTDPKLSSILRREDRASPRIILVSEHRLPR